MARRTLVRAAPLEDASAAFHGPGALLIEDGRIASHWRSDAAPPPDAAVVEVGGVLAPGLIDLHYHGDLGLRDPRDALSALRSASASLARHGVTAFLPTTVAWPAAELRERLVILVEALGAGGWPGAVPIGLHLEGPWIRAEAAGAQPPAGLRPYDAAEGRELFERGEGAIRMVTLAPELPGSRALEEELSRRSIAIALGHTLADAASVDAAVSCGARHATHLFNAMGPLHQRGPGVAGLLLADDRLSCDVIADGAHVHPDWLRVAARAKGEQLILISDRVEAADSAHAVASGFGSGPIHSDGTAWRLADGRLAGSHLWLDDAIRNVTRWRVMDPYDALASCTRRPARLLGIEAERGTLQPGARADFAILSRTGDVVETWIDGRRIH